MNKHEVISFAFQIPTFALAIALPLIRIIKKGAFWRAFFFMWLNLVVWTILVSMIFPAIVYSVLHDRAVFDYFPEGPAIIAVVFSGWIPCFLFCGLGWLIRDIWMGRRRKSD